jgi:hypothetical protein
MQEVTFITANPGYAKRILLVAMELKLGGARIVSDRRKEPNYFGFKQNDPMARKIVS